MTDAALSLDRVDKVYNPRSAHPVHAVRAMSLDIAPGEIAALLGSSGCGKTSTLRMIAGFEEVSGGTIAVGGTAIHELPPRRRNVAMAFEGYSLYPPLTVRDNIGFALKASERDRGVIDGKVREIAHLLEIEPFLDRYPSSISAGQQQRASLGRALVRPAGLYLLDEPMGQLEPALRAVLRGRLKHFLKERRMTTVLVTHDQTEANALADRIAVMEDGVLQQFATPLELKNRPANLFVGTFIGEPPMNVIAAEAAPADGDGLVYRLPHDGVLSYGASEISAPVREAVLARRNVVLGVRPHAVRLSGEGLAGEGLKVRVASNQWLGDQTHIAADFADQTLVVVEHDRVDAPRGTDAHVTVAARDLHVFDTRTGDAIAHGSDLA